MILLDLSPPPTNLCPIWNQLVGFGIPQSDVYRTRSSYFDAS
jgi:hypothetical protein